MEFKKGDRIVHLGLELVGTFVEYAWNSDEEAIVSLIMKIILMIVGIYL